MKTLARLLAAAALTLSFVLMKSLRAEVADFPSLAPTKMTCSSSDRSTLLDVTMDPSGPVNKLTSVLLKDKNSIHNPKITPKNFAFYSDTTLIQIEGTLPDGHKITFAAQPSVADPSTWSATLKENGTDIKLSCDLY